MSSPLLLDQKVLSTLAVSCRSIADLIEVLLRVRYEGDAASLPKLSFSSYSGNLFQAMMAVSERPAYATIKAVGLSPDNAKRGLPHIGSTVTLFDTASALPVALIDGGWLTGVRTAAITLLAASRLAPPNSRRMGFIGAGVQARSHLAAFREMFPVEEVWIYSRTSESSQRFADQIDAPGIRTWIPNHPEEVLENSDVVISSVPDAEGFKPFLDPNRLPRSSFGGLVDCGRSWSLQKLDPNDWVCIDDREQDRLSKAPLVEPSRVNQDISELVLNTFGVPESAGRRFFVFRGMAIGDLAAAIIAYKAALEAGVDHPVFGPG